MYIHTYIEAEALREELCCDWVMSLLFGERIALLLLPVSAVEMVRRRIQAQLMHRG